jgi:hypothetical protein
MPGTDPGSTWQEGLAAFGVIAVVAFLVTWVLTDVLKVPRTQYIAMLFVVALGLGGAYCAWSGTSANELFTSGVGWALVAGLIATAVAVPLVRKLPAHPHATGSDLVGLMLWEDWSTASRRPCCFPRCPSSPSGRRATRSAGRTTVGLGSAPAPWRSWGRWS